MPKGTVICCPFRYLTKETGEFCRRCSKPIKAYMDVINGVCEDCLCQLTDEALGAAK